MSGPKPASVCRGCAVPLVAGLARQRAGGGNFVGACRRCEYAENAARRLARSGRVVGARGPVKDQVLPAGPLLAEVERRLMARGHLVDEHGREVDRPTAPAVAVYAGVHRRTAQGWARAGAVVTVRLADRVATELGVHPVQLWPVEWAELV